MDVMVEAFWPPIGGLLETVGMRRGVLRMSQEGAFFAAGVPE